MDKSFWEGRRVFITGHTGFKGSWLSLLLGRMGARITGYSLPPDGNPNLFEVARVAGQIERSIFADVRDIEVLREELTESDPEILFHLAAQPLVQTSILEPVETFSSNVMGAVHVLESARGCDSLRSIVVVTSDKCYEDQAESGHLTESDPIGGTDPYSVSKACVELLTRSFFRSYWHSGRSGVGISTARAGNCIGGGDWAKDRLIPDFVRASAAKRPLKLGNPLAIRPWQHVLDPLSGYLILAQRLWCHPVDFSGPWNFGPENEECRTVEWMVEYMSHLWEVSLPWESDPHLRKNEVNTLRLDHSRAKSRLDWIPRWNIEEGLERTLAWYRHHLDDPESMEQFSHRQIEEYLAKWD